MRAPTSCALLFAAAPLLSPGLHGMSVESDVCEWPKEFRPLYGEEWLDKRTRAVRLPNTATETRVYATDDTAHFWDLVDRGAWEPLTFEVIRVLHSYAPGAHVDIGAWVGPTSLHAAHFARGPVYSLEPDPRAFSQLHANVLLNPSLSSNGRMRVFRHCIGSSTGPVLMSGPGKMGDSMSRVHAADASAPVGPITWPAQCSTMADFMGGMGLLPADVALIKVDTEGAELVILPSIVAWLDSLRGLDTTAGSKPPLLIEMHPPFWGRPSVEVHAELAPLLARWEHVYCFNESQSGLLADCTAPLVRYNLLLTDTPMFIRQEDQE